MTMPLLVLLLLLFFPCALVDAVAPTVPPPTTVPGVNPHGYWDSIALVYAGVLPWGVTFVLYAWYAYSGDGVFSLISWSITLTTVSAIPVQAYFNDLQPDPYYSAVTHWAFPNLESIAIGLLIVYWVFFRYWYGVRITWFQCFVLALLFLTPPILHVWRGRIAAWKVGISLLWGAVVAATICPFIWINQMGFAYLFNAPPIHGWYRESVLLRNGALVTYRRLKKWNVGRELASQRDQVPTDYPVDFVLWDLGFLIFPHDLPRWAPDVALGTLIVLAVLRICLVPLPDKRNWLEVWIRLLFVWGTMYFLRGFTVGITRFPRLIPGGPMPAADGLFAGLWRLITGSGASEADFMFSGHTATMTLFGLFVSYYTYHHLFSKLYWVLVACGYWSVLAARIHYSADMVVAVIITWVVFHLFHAIADPDWLAAWRSVIVIEVPAAEYPLPLRIAAGTRELLVYERESSLLAPKGWDGGEGGDDDDGLRYTHVRTGRFSTPDRRRAWRWIVHLLGGS